VALYHLCAKVIGRSAGRSATAAAAYRAGERIRDERIGETFDYTRRHGVEHTEIRAPDNAPEWMKDRAQLWNAVEKVEKRRDAQLAREVEVSLPRELSKEQRLEAVREFVDREFVSKGMVADVAIHCPDAADAKEQPHAHIMLTMRDLTGDGFGSKNRGWNGSDKLEGWREAWADHANRALEQAGHDERIDHRSLKDQGIDREPQIHLGRAAKLEKRGVETDRGTTWKQIQERNLERGRLGRALDEIKEQAARLIDVAKTRLDAILGRSPAPDRRAEGPTHEQARDAALGHQQQQQQPEAQPSRLDAILGRHAPDSAPQRQPETERSRDVERDR
jgi:ATP-dependent exoDNAse (exonuclease V) alpha subunit